MRLISPNKISRLTWLLFLTTTAAFCNLYADNKNPFADFPFRDVMIGSLVDENNKVISSAPVISYYNYQLFCPPMSAPEGGQMMKGGSHYHSD